MKEKVRAIYEMFLGILFLSTVLAGYYGEESHMWEYCFISGITVGIVFCSSLIYYIVKKSHYPVWVYFDCMVAILIIFIATVTIRLNLDGAFWFIHIINPIALFIYWVLFCNHTELKNWKLVMTDLCFPIFYMILSFVRLKITGLCAFPANMILVGVPLWTSLLIILGLCAVFFLLGLLLHCFNRSYHRRFMKEN